MRSVDIEELGALGIIARTIFLGRQSFGFLVWGQHISDSRSQRERERTFEVEATGLSVSKTLGYVLNEAANYMGRPENMARFLK